MLDIRWNLGSIFFMRLCSYYFDRRNKTLAAVFTRPQHTVLIYQGGLVFCYWVCFDF